MKIKKFISTIVLCTFLTQPLIAFADPDDPILGLMGTNKTNSESANQATTKKQPVQTKNTSKPITTSPNPDDDDPDFPTDDKPKDNNFGAMNNGSDAVTNMLLQSVSLMGIRYKWGGNSPTSGMDCSGFVRYVYQKSLGITLPRTAAEQAKIGRRVPINDLQPGDLMFFNSRRGSNTHVGMYLGNNKFIQSPRTGDVIKISEFTDSWRSRFNGAKRIVQDNSKSAQNSDDNASLQNLQNVRDEPLPVAYRPKSSKTSHSRNGTRSSTKKGSKSNSTKKGSSTKSNKTSNKSSKSATINSKSTKTTAKSSTKSSSTKKKKSTN